MIFLSFFDFKRILKNSLSPTCGLLALLVLPTQTWAGDDQDIDPFFLMSLEELLDQEVVTASLQPESLSDTISTTYVITSEQIRTMGARTIYDALTQVPGLTVSSNKSGSNKLFSRGIGSRFSAQFLLMIDGHALNDPSSGGATVGRYDRISTDNIKRIEVVQGPSSALYGSNALIGTINVITKKGSDIKGAEVTVSTEFDEKNHAFERYNLLYGDRFENGWEASLNIHGLKGDGVERWVDQDSIGQSSAGDTREEDYDIDVTLSNERLRLHGRYDTTETGDTFGLNYILTDDSKLDDSHGFVDVNYKIISEPNYAVEIRGAADQWQGEHYYVISPASSGFYSTKLRAETYAYSTELRTAYTGFSQHQIIGGLSYKYEETKNPKFWINEISIASNWIKPSRREIWAIFFNDTYQITDSIQASISGRYDDYNDFGSSFNPRIGMSWQIDPVYKVKIQYGTAFRAPDFVSQYSTNNPFVISNPDLDPEEITTWELGFSMRPNPRVFIQTTFFHSKVDDLIGEDGSTATVQWNNTDDVTSKGLELNGRYDITDRLQLSGSYTFVDLKYSRNYPQPTTPSHSGSLNLDYQCNNKVNINIHGFAQDSADRADDDTRDEMAGYVVFNSTIIAKITEHIETQFSVYNLTDKRYAYPAPAGTLEEDYTAPARSFLLGLKYIY